MENFIFCAVIDVWMGPKYVYVFFAFKYSAEKTKRHKMLKKDRQTNFLWDLTCNFNYRIFSK